MKNTANIARPIQSITTCLGEEFAVGIDSVERITKVIGCDTGHKALVFVSGEADPKFEINMNYVVTIKYQ